jgi:hypothetical protein
MRSLLTKTSLSTDDCHNADCFNDKHNIQRIQTCSFFFPFPFLSFPFLSPSITHSKARQRAHTSEVRSHRLHHRERTLAFHFLSYSLCHLHFQKHNEKVVQAAIFCTSTPRRTCKQLFSAPSTQRRKCKFTSFLIFKIPHTRHDRNKIALTPNL